MIEVRDLWKSYGKHGVLKGLSLDIQDNEILVILGRSGVGKSVLLRQIIGIERPDKGSIKIDGKTLSEMSEKQLYQLAKTMGMLFQGAALFDSLTIGENIAFYLRQHEKKLTEQEIQIRVAGALDMVGLSDKQQAMPSDLSGGMRKRAALARVIVYRPRIILYDEPTTGLDSITSMQINELISKIQTELNAAVIVVTHDLSTAMIADKLALHHEGKIAHLAPKNEFLQIKDPLLDSFFESAIQTGVTIGNLKKREVYL